MPAGVGVGDDDEHVPTSRGGTHEYKPTLSRSLRAPELLAVAGVAAAVLVAVACAGKGVVTEPGEVETIGNAPASKMAPWPPEGVDGTYATFAGGCFWGLNLAFDRVEGVKASAAGYIGA